VIISFQMGTVVHGREPQFQVLASSRVHFLLIIKGKCFLNLAPSETSLELTVHPDFWDNQLVEEKYYSCRGRLVKGLLSFAIRAQNTLLPGPCLLRIFWITGCFRNL
jgi:hypothetical protein